MLPRPTIEAFDAWLTTRSLRLDAIVVGGSALALLGVTNRQTRDFGSLHPELPEEIEEAAREFAAHLRGEGVQLADDWLNNGPMQLADVLPDGGDCGGQEKILENFNREAIIPAGHLLRSSFVLHFYRI